MAVDEQFAVLVADGAVLGVSRALLRGKFLELDKVVVYEINPEYSGICEIVNIAHSFSRMYGTKNNIDILTKK